MMKKLFLATPDIPFDVFKKCCTENGCIFSKSEYPDTYKVKADHEIHFYHLGYAIGIEVNKRRYEKKIKPQDTQ